MPTSFQSFNPGDLIEDSHVEQFIQPIQNLETGKTWYAPDTGAVNAFVVTLDPVPAAYTAGMIVHFKANNDVTGPATINVNGLGAKPVLKEGGSNLATGDIVEDQMVAAVYDGTEFHVVSAVMNPTIISSTSENTLVYAEVTKEQSTGANLSLPSFVFDNTKSYLLELQLLGTSTTSVARVTLSDGVTSYAYPSSVDTVKSRAGYDSLSFRKILPTLSGSHTVVVNATAVSYVSVKIYEINDNLVYADFSPAVTGSTVTTQTLASSFTAVSGHKYLMMLDVTAYTTASVAAYLTDGVSNHGIPQSGPLTDLVTSGVSLGSLRVERVLSGLSGRPLILKSTH